MICQSHQIEKGDHAMGWSGMEYGNPNGGSENVYTGQGTSEWVLEPQWSPQALEKEKELLDLRGCIKYMNILNIKEASFFTVLKRIIKRKKIIRPALVLSV